MLALLLLTVAWPASASAFDLLEAWQLSQGADHAFAASRAERDAGLEQRALGEAEMLPRAGLEGRYTQNQNRAPAVNTRDNRVWRVELSQPLFDLKAWSSVGKGRIGSELSLTVFDDARQQQMLKVARSYFDVLLARDTLAFARAASKAYAQQVEEARAAYNVGGASILGVYEAEASLDTAQANEIVATSMLAVRSQMLNSLTGLDSAAIRPLSKPIELSPPEPAQLEIWLARAQEGSTAIQAARQQQALAGQDLLAARAGHLPTLRLTAAYEDSAVVRGDGRDSRAGSTGVVFSMPLFAGGAINAKRREASALLLKASEELEATRSRVREELVSAYMGVSNGAALVRANEQRLRSARNKAEATRIGREVGASSQLDLLEAEREVFDTERQLAESRYNYLFARLQLPQLAGTLDEGVLRGINRYF
ncbi:MAG: TolC family outer membrane protein [Rubrivivax sp.]